MAGPRSPPTSCAQFVPRRPRKRQLPPSTTSPPAKSAASDAGTRGGTSRTVIQVKFDAEHLRAFDKITFPRDVSDGQRTFAKAGDTGEVMKWWPVANTYTVWNDAERVEGQQRFDVDYWFIEKRDKEVNENGDSALF